MSLHPSRSTSIGSASIHDFEQRQREARLTAGSTLGILPGLQYPITDSLPIALARVAADPSWSSHDERLAVDSQEAPDRTLEGVLPTSIEGVISENSWRQQRDEDWSYCRRHFDGMVVSTDKDELLRRIGGKSWQLKHAELEKDVRPTALSDLRLKIAECWNEEAKKTPNPTNSCVQTDVGARYWLSALADLATPSLSSCSSPFLDYFPSPTTYLPTEGDYLKRRKYDAALRPTLAPSTTIRNYFVNIEFTTTKAPSSTHNPLLGKGEEQSKLRQSIVNADDGLVFQPTRLFLPSLSFFGSFDKATLIVSRLSPERLDLAYVENCFGENLPWTCALLSIFRSSTVYELGLNPIIEYTFSNTDIAASPAVAFLPPCPTSPATEPTREGDENILHVSSEIRITLDGTCGFDDNGEFVTLKFAHVANIRAWRETINNLLLSSSCNEPPSYAPTVISSFACQGTLPPLPLDSLHPPAKRSQPSSPSAIVQRHLEGIAFKSIRGLKPLSLSPSSLAFGKSGKLLVTAIYDAFDRGLIHGDISSGNVLVSDNETPVVHLIDWEVGRAWREVASASFTEVTGTVDTMSHNALSRKDGPLPHDDVESALYLFIKVLTTTFTPADKDKELWASHLRAYKWNVDEAPRNELAMARAAIWSIDTPGTISFDTSEYFERTDVVRATLHRNLIEIAPLKRRVEAKKLKGDQGALLADLRNMKASIERCFDSVALDMMKWKEA